MWCEPINRKRSAHDCAPMTCDCTSRRSLLKSFGAVAAGTALATPTVWAQGGGSTPAKPHRIDVHHHFYPPWLLEAWRNANVRNPPVVQQWKLATGLEQMD